jgi:hypothetical protein
MCGGINMKKLFCLVLAGILAISCCFANDFKKDLSSELSKISGVNVSVFTTKWYYYGKESDNKNLAIGTIKSEYNGVEFYFVYLSNKNNSPIFFLKEDFNTTFTLFNYSSNLIKEHGFEDCWQLLSELAYYSDDPKRRWFESITEPGLFYCVY